MPAPTFSTVRASPSASQILAAIRGSVRRVAGYADPIVSYNCAPNAFSCSSGVVLIQFLVYGDDHGGGAVALFEQQAAQPAQARDRVGGRVVDQIRDLTQPEAQPPVGQHLPQPLHIPRRVGPVPGRGPRGRLHQADLVIVMQRAHGHAGQLGHMSHGQVLLHATDYAA